MSSVVNHETGELEEPDTINYDIHPVAGLFPFIEGEAFREFVEDIRVNGQREPVVLDTRGRLLDGRNRARACQVLGIDVKETRYSGDDAEAWIISHNVHRRHLTESQRAMIAARVATLRKGGTEGNQNATKTNGSDEPSVSKVERSAPRIVDAANKFNIGRESVKRARSVIESGDEELVRSVESGEVSVTAAAKQVKAKKPTAAPAAPPKRASRDEKADLLRDLAEQGYSSRQMQERLSYSTDAQVRELAREYGIEITADKVLGKTRRLDSTRIAAETVSSLEGLASGVELIDYDALAEEELVDWADSLTESLRVLNRFRKQIKESIQ